MGRELDKCNSPAFSTADQQRLDAALRRACIAIAELCATGNVENQNARKSAVSRGVTLFQGMVARADLGLQECEKELGQFCDLILNEDDDTITPMKRVMDLRNIMTNTKHLQLRSAFDLAGAVGTGPLSKQADVQKIAVSLSTSNERIAAVIGIMEILHDAVGSKMSSVPIEESLPSMIQGCTKVRELAAKLDELMQARLLKVEASFEVTKYGRQAFDEKAVSFKKSVCELAKAAPLLNTHVTCLR